MHTTDHPGDFTDGKLPIPDPTGCYCPDDGEECGGRCVNAPARWASDPVDHPDHYTAGGIECIDALQAAMTEEQFVGFCRGNAVKYLWRAGRKGDVVEDLRKASWYIDREIGARS